MSRRQPSLVPRTAWTGEEFERDRQAAIQVFRSERIDEPLERYLDHFDAVRSTVDTLLTNTADLTQIDAHAIAILTDLNQQESLRYLAGPPISSDDLKTLVDSNLSRRTLQANPVIVEQAIDTILAGLDHRRFPWVRDRRSPTQAERQAAIIATAAMVAMRRTETARRTTEKTAQEERVAAALIAAGFTRIAIPQGYIATIADAPRPGEFCREVKLGERKADLVVGLWDRRIMPIECKVSNSSTNSIKRLNNDAAAKAETWLKDFGTLQIVPAAVLSGVYKASHLHSAQQRGLTIYWAQGLDAMIEWIDSTRAK